jgi:dipeptidyl aminopeptidase/acylaminoacyl peptidase
VKRLVVAAAALALAACPRQEPPPGIGKRVAEGAVQALRPSGDGQYLAFLDACAPVRDRTVPVGTSSCDLRVVPAAGGETILVAHGVTTLPGGFAWSSDGHVLAALDGLDLGSGQGTLVAWSPGGGPRRLGEGVSFWAFAPRGRLLGFAWRGQLQLWRPGAEAEPLPGLDGVATFEFHPQGEAGVPLLLARRALAAGGDLLAATPGRKPVRVGGPAGDYGFSPGGDRFAFTERSGEGRDLHLVSSSAPGAKGPKLGEDVASFAFSHDGRSLAFVAGEVPGRLGDLWAATGAERPVRLAAGVGEYRWARGAARLAWLQGYDPRVRSGTIASGPPGGGKTAPLGRNVSAFEMSPDGEALAFLEHTVQGGYSVDLQLARGGAAVRVAPGVFGFDFSPDGKEIWYRTACRRSAEACDLHAAPVSDPARDRRIADGVKSFEWDRRAPGRVLLGWSREDRVALDIAVWEEGKLTPVDRSVLPGSAAFLAPDSRRIAYAVNDPRRQGVYVAELPR